MYLLLGSCNNAAFGPLFCVISGPRVEWFSMKFASRQSALSTCRNLPVIIVWPIGPQDRSFRNVSLSECYIEVQVGIAIAVEQSDLLPKFEVGYNLSDLPLWNGRVLHTDKQLVASSYCSRSGVNLGFIFAFSICPSNRN